MRGCSFRLLLRQRDGRGLSFSHIPSLLSQDLMEMAPYVVANMIEYPYKKDYCEKFLGYPLRRPKEPWTSWFHRFDHQEELSTACNLSAFRVPDERPRSARAACHLPVRDYHQEKQPSQYAAHFRVSHSRVHIRTNAGYLPSVYVAGQVPKKLLRIYLPRQGRSTTSCDREKGSTLYDAIEASPEVNKIIHDDATRSRINICFRVTKGGDVDAAERSFLEESTAQGLTGLKGHRSPGGMGFPERFINPLTKVTRAFKCRIGIRASNHDAVPLKGAEKLATFIRIFAKA